ncbi:MAG: hypothetical protein K2O00_06110 [Muribaculaceae bacterium]|nr:hypothetical protein [Muribaculaceae bacterium]
MKKLIKSLMLALFAAPLAAAGQVVTTSPAIVQTDSRDIVVTFHANLGNGQLAGLSSNDAIYAHTGVITNQSTSNSDWKYAPSWGDNSAKYKLLYVSPDTWELIIPSINEYYNIPDGVTVKSLAFVFRNANNSLEGKEADGGDIYVPVYPQGFQMTIDTDMEGLVITDSNPVKITVNTTSPADITIYQNSVNAANIISSQQGVTTVTVSKSFTQSGDYKIIAVAKTATVSRQNEITITRLGDSAAATFPGGVPRQGVTVSDSGDFLFCIAAPKKQNVTLVGSWNDYKIVASQSMNYQDYQGDRYFWTKVSGLPSGENIYYYYLVDGEIPVGDPYAHLILDPYNDRYISPSVYPDMPAYPTQVPQSVPVAVFNTTMDDYDWQVTDFKGVAQSDLIIYELLIRDFTGTEGKANGNGTVKGVIEKLDYLKDLGVNAIELLPIMEFNGNNSWGYNTNFYMAPDKAYGTPDDYRRLVDECHKRGMAVILDIVFNQSDGLHPWYQMYRPAENPFYNASSPHAYSVLNDWKQEYPLVQQQWHDAMAYWLTAYNVDGFRFDLVKGLGDNDSYGNTYYPSTNTFGTPSDANTNRFNATRVARMKALHDAMRKVKPDAYFINENLATAQEENDMAKDGEINWANINTEARQFAMGYSSNSGLNRFYAPDDSRTWGSTVSYAESHDEERMAYSQSQYGASGIKGNLTNSMRRLGSVAAQMLMSPGAHMIWQFQEFGANESTKNADGSNNTSPKKVVWSYLNVAARKGLMDNYRELCAIRNGNREMFNEGTATTMNCGTNNWTAGRTIILKNGNKELYCVVNPNTSTRSIAVPFTNAGSDYQILSKSYGTTPTINGKNVVLQAGAYAVFGTKDLSDNETISDDAASHSYTVSVVDHSIRVDGDYDTVQVYTLSGAATGTENLPEGVYIVVVDGTAQKVLCR